MKEQEIISAQQELKHLRTRCGKVYALGNNRFRTLVQTTPVLRHFYAEVVSNCGSNHSKGGFLLNCTTALHAL